MLRSRTIGYSLRPTQTVSQARGENQEYAIVVSSSGSQWTVLLTRKNAKIPRGFDMNRSYGMGFVIFIFGLVGGN